MPPNKESEHIIGAVRTCYEVECGKCQHRWQEHATNQLRDNFDPGITPGDYLECPKCQEELAVKFEYRGDM